MADHSQSDIELVHSALRPLLMMLGDFRNLNPSLLTKLTHMVELFPTLASPPQTQKIKSSKLCKLFW